MIAVVGLSIYWFGFRSHTNFSQFSISKQNFNADLIVAKQKCQESFTQYNEQNQHTGIRAHLNAKLNACLVDDLYNRPDGDVQTSSIVDIYDSNRKLLELDIFTKPEASIPAGAYLFVNGVKILTFNPAKEYDKRRAALFEEPVPNY